jgi:hypothetical protein
MNIKNRQQVLVAAAIALVVIFAGDKLLFTPLVAKWQERSEAIVKLRKQVDDGAKLLLREPGLRSRWDHMRTNALPDSTSIAEQEVLKGFDFWSEDSRITIMSITPQWKRDNDERMTLECRVDAAGNLQTITRFLYNVEKDPLALKMDTVEIAARDTLGQQLALTLQISGLSLNLKQP